MTRETALRRMLAGRKVEHPTFSGFFFYDSQKFPPIRVQLFDKFDYAMDGTRGFFAMLTGWKEYKGAK